MLVLRRIAANVDVSDIVIGGAIAGFGLGFALKFDYMTGLIAACSATLVLIAIGIWRS